MTGPVVRVGGADAELDQLLDAELDRFNAAATPEVPAAEELTVRVEHEGRVVAGVSGWTWGQAAGIGMVWVEESVRGSGVGTSAMTAFEDEARRRGCTHVFVTSFTFQAPGFYESSGYQEIFRWEGVPTLGRDDVHFRKELVRPEDQT